MTDPKHAASARALLEYVFTVDDRKAECAIAQALAQVEREAYEKAAKECKDYAHSGTVSMMRRQVAYACERRIRALAEGG